MNPVTNPFAPGAGAPPPELAGRDELLATVRVAVERVRLGRPAKSVLMIGLRGVGKTVLLDRMRLTAEGAGIRSLRVEAPEDRSLPAMLVGAGLPQLRGRLGRAKSYSERLFNFHEIGPLSADQARLAVAKPARDQGVTVTDDALDLICRETLGYPYFVQEWGKHSWDAAEASPITRRDVERASATAVAALDMSFFGVRFDRLTPAEKRYLRGMAELGPGPHRSGDIAEALGRPVTQLGPTRNKLIAKGMVWSPHHGDTAFTVPLFDQFMRRIMPDSDWRQRQV